MIKGLYFKLNMEKRPDKDIYKFFEKEAFFALDVSPLREYIK